MDEELELIQLDKPLKGKSAEQLLKHTINPDLDPLERCLLLLSKGDVVQKLSVLNNLPQLIIENSKIQDQVIPKIIMMLPTASSEFQIMSAGLYRNLVEKNINADAFIPCALNGMQYKDPAIVFAWSDALLQSIPELPIEIVMKEILPVVLNKCETKSPVMQKMVAIPFLGKICTHAHSLPKTIKSDILPHVKILCRDIHFQVRVAMCMQFPAVSTGLGISYVKEFLLNEFINLCNDEHVNVRAAAGSIFVSMFPFLSEDTLKSEGVSIARKLCSQTFGEYHKMAFVIAKEIGRICFGLQEYIDPCTGEFFLECFSYLSHLGLGVEIKCTPLSTRDGNEKDPLQDILCRQHCAYNLPAIVQFVKAVCPKLFENFYKTFHDLLTDPCYLVRKNVATGVHEIAKVLGSDIKIIDDDIIFLLRNESEEVLSGIIPHIQDIFILLCKYQVLQLKYIDATVLKFGKALFKCETTVSRLYNWRLQLKFFSELECLPMVLPSEYIYCHFVPLLLEKLTKGRYKPVKEQIIVTLLVILRHNSKVQQQTDIRNRILKEIRFSMNCYTRRLFISLCTESIAILTKDYFKQYFFHALLTLADDPVANIRMSLIEIIPKLNATLNTQKDRNFLVKMESIMLKRNSEENDNDCRQKLSELLKEIPTSLPTSNLKKAGSKSGGYIARQSPENKECGNQKISSTSKVPRRSENTSREARHKSQIFL